VPGRADSCVAQFSRDNAAVQGFEVVADRAESIGDLLGPEDWSSLQFGQAQAGDCESEGRYMRTSKPVRSRVVMGAKTVQGAR
jgi:hypothetical protein